MRINCLVTGVNGFVGSHLGRVLQHSTCVVTGTSRYKNSIMAQNSNFILKQTNQIDGATNWRRVLKNQDVIVHLANVAHDSNKPDIIAQKLYRTVNVDGSLNLARQAEAHGVRLFIYISSIKVNGDVTGTQPFTYQDQPTPRGAYAISKYEAEQALQDFCASTQMRLIIIRPPLLYGQNVKGNLHQLLKAVNHKIPFPFASIVNSRDLMSLDNFSDLIQACIKHSNLQNNIFLCCDNDPISTIELVQYMAKASNKHAVVFPFPVSWLKRLGSIVGREDAVARLVSDLRVDMKYTMNVLSWAPPYSVAESMQLAFAHNEIFK